MSVYGVREPVYPCDTAPVPRFSYEEDCQRIQHLIPKYSLTEIESLKVKREGDLAESHMISLGLHKGVRENQSYQITAHGLCEVDSYSRVRQLEKEKLFSSQLPSHFAMFKAVWDKTPCDGGEKDNILGGNGTLRMESSVLNIPVVEADERSLAYYGATLLSMGDVVEFEDDQYPIWAMSLGENYVSGFIMQQNGFYLEYHNDKPHFHMPLSEDSSGCYLLARRVESTDSNDEQYHITGFRIPFGKAVYTYKGAIHCDAALTGHLWIVGYTSAEDFSTVLLRDKAGQKTNICFEEHG